MGAWYEKLDFDDNPFTTNPAKYTNALVGLDETFNEVHYRINAGSLLVVLGEDGCGKTSILMRAAKAFGGKGMVAYVDCEQLDKKLNITHVLQDKYGLIGRIFNKKPKNMILLLDNVQNISKVNNERLKYYFDQGYVKSIVFACTSLQRAKFSDSLKDRIGDRIVKLERPTPEDAPEIVRRRLGSKSQLFNEKQIKDVYATSGENPRVFLENCEKIAEQAVTKKRKRAQQIDMEEVLGVKNE